MQLVEHVGTKHCAVTGTRPAQWDPAPTRRASN